LLKRVFAIDVLECARFRVSWRYRAASDQK